MMCGVHPLFPAAHAPQEQRSVELCRVENAHFRVLCCSRNYLKYLDIQIPSRNYMLLAAC